MRHDWQYKNTSGDAESEVAALLNIAICVSEEFPKLGAEDCLENAKLAVEKGEAFIEGIQE